MTIIFPTWLAKLPYTRIFSMGRYFCWEHWSTFFLTLEIFGSGILINTWSQVHENKSPRNLTPQSFYHLKISAYTVWCHLYMTRSISSYQNQRKKFVTYVRYTRVFIVHGKRIIKMRCVITVLLLFEKNIHPQKPDTLTL